MFNTAPFYNRPPRKRARTLTYATPEEPAQRTRLTSPHQLNCPSSSVHSQHEKSRFASTSQHQVESLVSPGHDLSSASPRERDSDRSPQSLKRTATPFPQRFIPVIRAALDLDHPMYTEQRNEFPFPIQPQPHPQSQLQQSSVPPLRNKHLDILIPADTTDGFSPDHTSRCYPTRPALQPLPTPPRSHPIVPTLFSCSPPSASCSHLPTQHSPTSTTATTSPWSSFASTYTATTAQTPLTPATPASLFESAANSLKKILMADELGMSVEEIDELNQFAFSQKAKRSGRVLVQREIKQRRLSSQKQESKSSSTGTGKAAHNIAHNLKHSSTTGRDEHTRKGSDDSARSTRPEVLSRGGSGWSQHWWREINWSRFSDTSSSASSSVSSLAPSARLSFDFDAGLDVEDYRSDEDYIDPHRIAAQTVVTGMSGIQASENSRKHLDIRRDLAKDHAEEDQ